MNDIRREHELVAKSQQYVNSHTALIAHVDKNKS